MTFGEREMAHPKVFNTVRLKRSADIHCPFCGEILAADAGLSCEHLLYIISGETFVSRTDRFDTLLGLQPGEGDLWPEFGATDRARFGEPYDAANKVRERLPDTMEFELYGPTASTFIGFAFRDDDLNRGGVDSKSARMKKKPITIKRRK